jgi:SAM-dependent methyltransferase
LTSTVPTADRPAADRVSEHYRGAGGRGYASAQYAAASVGAALFLRLLGRHLRGADTVVDFGCGSGALLERIDAPNRVGVEVNDAIRPQASRSGARVVARPEEVETESVDALTSNHVLEHTLQPFLELREMHRMLRPGGRLLLCLPLDDWRTHRRPRVPDPDNHLYAWTPRLLRNLLTEAGFEVVSTRVVPYGFPGRFTVPLARALPPRLFDALAVLTAFAIRRRQLVAVAVRPQRGRSTNST